MIRINILDSHVYMRTFVGHDWQKMSLQFIQKDNETGMWNMISSPATPTVSYTEIWEFSKSQRDIIDAVTISKIECIWDNLPW